MHLLDLNYWGLEKPANWAKVASEPSFEVSTQHPVGGDSGKGTCQALLP